MVTPLARSVAASLAPIATTMTVTGLGIFNLFEVPVDRGDATGFHHAAETLPAA